VVIGLALVYRQTHMNVKQTLSSIAAIVCTFAFGLPSVSLAQTAADASQEVAESAPHDDSVNPWWEDSPWAKDDRGFHWYPPEKKVVKPVKKKPVEQQAAVPKPKRLQEITDAKDLREEVDRRKRVAIMNPSPENMYAYLEGNKFIQDKAAMFTDVWRRTVWQNSDLDYNVRNPTANFAQVDIKQARTRAYDAQVKDLSKNNGLMFFFRGDCQYCKIQAPILQMVTRQYGFRVMAVSLDGGGMDEFPGAKVDNGISKIVSNGEGVLNVPALYLVSDDTKRVVPIGAGVLAMDEIVDRIRVLVNTAPGTEF
jgi:conjugal transfer pilus assembly protein TraF